jgi:rhomboid family GlyGly-CTERM serine protease
VEYHVPRRDVGTTNWLTVAAVVAVLTGLWLAGPAITEALRYERAAVLGGQWWRLATGHLVHADAAHLAWNLAGAALVWWLFAAEYSWRGWCAIVLASATAIDLGFVVLQPGLDWYVGLSGVLHGCMAAGLAAWLARARDPLVVAIAAIFAAKLAWEHWRGPLPFTAGTLALPVIVEAHSYGALGGLAAAALLLVRRRRSAPL